MTHTRNTTAKPSPLQSIVGATMLGLLLSAAALAPAFAMSETLETQAAMSADSSTLVIEVTGFESDSGQMLLALFDSAQDYDDETPLREASVTITDGQARVEFSGLSVDEYAFKLFHDANNDGALDTDMLGIPSEDYAFSQDASDPFSAPEWAEAKFALPHGTMTRSIALND